MNNKTVKVTKKMKSIVTQLETTEKRNLLSSEWN